MALVKSECVYVDCNASDTIDDKRLDQIIHLAYNSLGIKYDEINASGKQIYDKCCARMKKKMSSSEPHTYKETFSSKEQCLIYIKELARVLLSTNMVDSVLKILELISSSNGGYLWNFSEERFDAQEMSIRTVFRGSQSLTFTPTLIKVSASMDRKNFLGFGYNISEYEVEIKQMHFTMTEDKLKSLATNSGCSCCII